MDDKCQIPKPEKFKGYANVAQGIIKLIEEIEQLKKENGRLAIIFDHVLGIVSCEDYPCSTGPHTF